MTAELCLANLTVGDAGPLELIDAAGAGGFDSVNMWLVEPPAMTHVANLRREAATVIGNARLIEAIRKRCAERSVTLFAASAGWIGPDFEPSSLAPALESVAALGGRSLAVVGWDGDRGRLVANFVALCEAAAPYGIAVNLEFMAYAALQTVQDARNFLASAAQPNAGIIVDVLHLARSGGTPAEVQALDPRSIASLQLCDAPLKPPPKDLLRNESVNDRLYPGDGELPLFELLDALPDGSVIELEVPVAALTHLSITERAKRCGDATRRFLATYGARPLRSDLLR